MTLDKIKVNPIFESLLPPLTDDEYDDLEKDIIARQKVLNPILVWSKTNEIVDGHNRFKIIEDNNIPEYSIDTLDFDTESAVMKWIVDHQFAKRNLTMSQKVILLQKVEEKVREEAKERQREAGGDKVSAKARAVSSNLNEPVSTINPVRTAAEMAKKMKISENTYRDAKLIVEKGTESQIERMDKGGKGNGVSTIAKEIKEGIPDGFRKCRVCGRILPAEQMKSGNETICKECRNKEDMEREEAKREEKTEEHKRPVTKRKISIPDPYGLADTYYNPDYVPEKTMNMIKAQLKSLFDDLDGSIKMTLDYYSELLKVKEQRDEVANDLAVYASHIKYIEGEVRNARY